jgi:predicted RNA-binding protein Jag
MKLHKALKKRKSLIGEIAHLKNLIKDKNSYLEGDRNAEKFDMTEANEKLMQKINELVGLKFAINEANQAIQSTIYTLTEYKALISFWNEVSVDEGVKLSRYKETPQTYDVHFDEKHRAELVNKYQKIVDALQEEIDTYNYTTDIPWDEPVEDEKPEK